jgi:hypothetical protein
MVVDAGDLSCTVLIIYGGGAAACTGLSPLSSSQSASLVTLTIPDQTPAIPGQHLALPVNLDPQGKSISSAVFSIDYDQTWLTFDDADGNKDGIPDAIKLNLPAGFVALVTHDAQDKDGEIDVVIYYLGLSQATLPKGNLITATFEIGEPQGDFVAEVNSSLDPRASFGSPTGASVPGTLVDGSIWIFNTAVNQIFLPFSVDTK